MTVRSIQNRQQGRAGQARRLNCLLLAVCCLSLAGCGSSRPETVPVRGKVTFNGGPFPKPGKIYFTTVKPADGFPGRPGSADFGADGQFSAMTYEPGDGLVPGTYRVAIVCWEKMPDPMNPEGGPGKSLVAYKFTSPTTSGLEVTIEPGSRPIELNYDIPSGK